MDENGGEQVSKCSPVQGARGEIGKRGAGQGNGMGYREWPHRSIACALIPVRRLSLASRFLALSSSSPLVMGTPESQSCSH
jgi:hypothetical protein